MTPEAARRVVTGLKEAGVDFVTFLPESRLGDIIPLMEEDPYFTLVRASHEGSAVSIACGASLVGKMPAVYMEASGLILSLYNLQAVAIRCGLPLLLLVSYTGSPGDKGNSVIFSLYGKFTEPLLQSMDIYYCVEEDDQNIEGRIADMVRLARAAMQPVCLLVTGEFTRYSDGESKL